MSLTPFCACLFLLLLLLVLDLRASWLLRRGIQTRTTKVLLALWPLQVLIHVVVLYIIASTPILPRRPVQLSMSFRSAPAPLSPFFPPLAETWKKKRLERL
jgi:hypothetical protein